MLKAVIFDLDGVICSTDEYHYEAWKAMADNIGVPFDKAVNNRLRGVSRMDSLDIILEQYPGQLSAAEKEALAEQLHIDVLPAILEQPRRYAFRYLQLEVLDASCKYCLRLEDAFCTAVTSAEDAALKPFAGTPRQEKLDKVACHTLRECMQEVFEDGPKRDRRLWMGDLRLQSLANYETFQNNDLVKRCLYLFAGTTLPEGKIGACLFSAKACKIVEPGMLEMANGHFWRGVLRMIRG